MVPSDDDYNTGVSLVQACSKETIIPTYNTQINNSLFTANKQKRTFTKTGRIL
uniref:Uncharacterized protein n=1 Tax=Arion vulgaris TaxID=1028688 RepID=A0A0B7AJL0_9EUPU